MPPGDSVIAGQDCTSIFFFVCDFIYMYDYVRKNVHKALYRAQ